MSNIDEIGKGVGMFIFGNILFYLGWRIFSALIDAVINIERAETGANSYLGAMVWISFFAMYICSTVIYPLYAVLSSSNPEVKTNIFPIFKGLLYWFLGTIACIIIFLIVNGLLAGLTDMTFQISTVSGGTSTVSNADANSTTHILGWLGVLACYIMYLVFLPFRQVMLGFKGKD
ncbi:hypothetical protein GF336_07785 [Candidatus Woesearchaeota archaeon]|nr:hypothetical protein [Candidatus Woesearchaeota archaeon]